MAINDITGDNIKSRAPNKNYADNYDRIFRKNKEADKKDKKDSKSNSKP